MASPSIEWNPLPLGKLGYTSISCKKTSTFQVQDRGIQQAPILGLWGANGVGSLPGDSSIGVSTATPSVGLSATSAAVGEFGTYLKSLISSGYAI